MQFSNDVEETFARALKLLLVSNISPICILSSLNGIFSSVSEGFSMLQSKGLVDEGQYVTLVQSGAQPIWREESTHHIQVRQVRG